MEYLKKRRLDADADADAYGQASSASAEEHLRSLLEPLAKSQLIDLLAKIGTKYASVAGEIISVASADPVHRKLFVRGLARNTSTETLCAAFQVHGEIEEAAVIHDKVTGKSRGYGFITYRYMESAQAALKAPSKSIDGRLTVCNLACDGLNGASTSDQAQRQLYIGGLSPDTSSEMLLNFFGRHGEIEEGSVAYNKDTNKSRGFGFVTYKTVEGAKRALNDPDRTLGGRNITVKYADNNKNKASSLSQLPQSVAPMSMPVAGDGGDGYYSRPVKHQAPSVSPLGYGCPQPQAFSSSYRDASYPPSIDGTYPGEPQNSFGRGLAEKEAFGMPQMRPSMGMSGSPYRMAKQ